MSTETPAFLTYLYALRDEEDRGALAALRRSAAGTPGTDPGAYPFVTRFVHANASRWDERAYYLTAALFALHPAVGGAGISIARALSHLRAASGSTELRFSALLQAHPDDLAVHLRHAVMLVASKEIAIDHELLFRHVRHFTHPDKWVQRAWAKDFYVAHESSTESEGASS
jgi:CRISPR system Cascade subunit CasB